MHICPDEIRAVLSLLPWLPSLPQVKLALEKLKSIFFRKVSHVS